jgi:hypothetical protein
MTVRARVADFLKEEHKPYCDDCIGKLLQLGSSGNRHMAWSATSSLEQSAGFKRQIETCTKCGKTTKLVTCAV